MSSTSLEIFFSRSPDEIFKDPEAPERGQDLLLALESGEIRAAQHGENGGWHVNTWVKRGILAIFRLSGPVDFPAWPGGAVDKDAFPPRTLSLTDGVRIVAGGSSVRRGSRLCPGAILMPPCFVNVGAWVGAGTMVDSHEIGRASCRERV